MIYKKPAEPEKILNDILFKHEKSHKRPAYGLEYPEYNARTAAKRFINLVLEPVHDLDKQRREYNPKHNPNEPLANEPFYIYLYPWLDNARYLLQKYLDLPITDQTIVFEAASDEGIHWRGESIDVFYNNRNSVYNVINAIRDSGFSASEFSLDVFNAKFKAPRAS